MASRRRKPWELAMNRRVEEVEIVHRVVTVHLGFARCVDNLFGIMVPGGAPQDPKVGGF